MKKLLCLLLAVLMLVCLCACDEKPDSDKNDNEEKPTTGTTTTTTAAPVSDAQKILGTWKTSVDLTDMMNTMLGVSMGEMGEFFVAKDIAIDIVQTFKADGTYEATVDEASFTAYMDAMKNLIKDGLTAYFEDVIAQANLEMTVDELLALSGTDMDTMLDQTFGSMALDGMADSFTSKGKYEVKDGKMYASESLDADIDENVYETYTLTDDTLTLLAMFGQESGDTPYPIVFTRVSA